MNTPTPEELATTIIGDAAARHLDWFRQRGLIADTIRAAVAAEREAIAAHFEREANADFDFLGKDVAAYVRARGKT